MSNLHHFRCDSCGQINRIPANAKPGAKCGRCKTALRTDGAPITLSDAELDALIAKSPVPVLVDFYADWCGPCRMLGPVLADLGQQRRGEVFVVKIDTEVHQRTAAQVGVQGIPAVHLWKGGKHVDEAVGARPLAFWLQWLAPHV